LSFSETGEERMQVELANSSLPGNCHKDEGDVMVVAVFNVSLCSPPPPKKWSPL